MPTAGESNDYIWTFPASFSLVHFARLEMSGDIVDVSYAADRNKAVTDTLNYGTSNVTLRLWAIYQMTFSGGNWTGNRAFAIGNWK